MGFGKKICTFFGVREDDRLKAALPHMSQEQLQQQYKMASLRAGSAATGLALNTSMLLYPGFLFGAALNLRQLVIARRTKKKLKNALKTEEHVDGTMRYFLLGAGMKTAIFAAFLGHIHAEDFVISHLNPMDMLAHVPHGDAVASFLPVEDIAQALHQNVHEAFAFPHAFNENAVVAALQELGNVPKEAVLGFGHELQTWGQIDGLPQLAHQVAVGPAIEANVPVMVGEKAMETVAEDWSRRRRRSSRR